MPQMTLPDINNVLPSPNNMGGDSLQAGINSLVQSANQGASAFTSGFSSFMNQTFGMAAKAAPTPPMPMTGLPTPFSGQSSDRSSDRVVPANYREKPVYQ